MPSVAACFLIKLSYNCGGRNSRDVNVKIFYKHTNINSPPLSGVLLTCLGYFWFILPRPCLFRFACGWLWVVPHFIEKKKACKARQKLETF